VTFMVVRSMTEHDGNEMGERKTLRALQNWLVVFAGM